MCIRDSFDSVTDRVADAVLMGGVAWYLIDKHEGHLVPVSYTHLDVYKRQGADGAGRDQVDPDAVGPQVTGQVAGE